MTIGMKMRWKGITLLIGIAILVVTSILLLLNGDEPLNDEPLIVPIDPEDFSVITLDNVKDVKRVHILGDIGSFSFTRQGIIFTSSSDNGAIHTVYAADYSTAESLLSLDVGGQIDVLAINPNGNEFAVAMFNGVKGYDIRLWNILEGRQEVISYGQTSRITDMAFSPDGKLLVSANMDNIVSLWDLKTRQLLGILEGLSEPVYEFIFSEDGKQIASSSSDDIRIWDVETKQEIRVFKANNAEPVALSYSPFDGSLVAAHNDSRIRFWSITDGKVMKELQGGRTNVDIDFTHDGSIMAAVSGYDTEALLRFWNTETGDLLAEIPFPRNLYGLGHIEFTPDGKFLAIGRGFSRKMELWGIPLPTT